MDIFLQCWGGVFYLLNKIFLSFAEGRADGRKLRIWGWAVFLIGMPAWLIILISKHDWMASGIELGGAPAMFLGLVVAIKGMEKTPPILKTVEKTCIYSFLSIGVLYSLYDFGGITAFSQVCEIGMIVGVLLGTHFLARGKPYGWFFFMLMNSSTAILMYIQNKPILALQQLVSLGFVIWGLYRAYKKKPYN